MKLCSGVLNAMRFLVHILRSVQVKRMALHPMKSLQLGVILGVAIVLAQPGSTQAIIGKAYVEMGDAGDSLSNPQFISGGPYEAITGSFGVATDVDVFAFYWAGGAFETTFYPTSTVDPTVALFDFSQKQLGSASGTGSFMLSLAGLGAGFYLLDISQDPQAGSADYTLTFSPFLPAQPAVPEPVTMMLVGSGLISLLGFRKKFQK